MKGTDYSGRSVEPISGYASPRRSLLHGPGDRLVRSGRTHGGGELLRFSGLEHRSRWRRRYRGDGPVNGNCDRCWGACAAGAGRGGRVSRHAGHVRSYGKAAVARN